MKIIVVISLLTGEALTDCSDPDSNDDFIECKVKVMLRLKFYHFYRKESLTDIYVSCVRECPDTLCTSGCARAFNENLAKEKFGIFWCLKLISYFFLLFKVSVPNRVSWRVSMFWVRVSRLRKFYHNVSYDNNYNDFRGLRSKLIYSDLSCSFRVLGSR